MSGRTSRRVLAGIFVFAGMMHFIIPASYVRIMPPWLPWHLELVYLSGVLEMAGGMGLLIPRTRRAAGIGLILLLIAVWPANLQMLLAARAADKPIWHEALLWIRLPLQLPLIWWIWRASRSPEGEISRAARGAR
ncbi:DoxX family protein [Longimicrobium sp.]|uniref:DoxX family protein n=1 Tax=Longimicrobium sp. TaxID=2029185 RepID=UPI003B3BB17A